MGPVVKMLAGLVLIAAGLYYIFYGYGYSGSDWISRFSDTGFSNIEHYPLADFIVLLNGAIPPLVVLLGLFIVWLEWDEMKIERELAAEERRARRRVKRKR